MKLFCALLWMAALAIASWLATAEELKADSDLVRRAVHVCAARHGDDAEGASVFPRLAGQHAEYVFNQLKIFGTRLRPHGTVMAGMTKNMTPGEMRAVAESVQSK
jgi:cytochrome c553